MELSPLRVGIKSSVGDSVYCIAPLGTVISSGYRCDSELALFESVKLYGTRALWLMLGFRISATRVGRMLLLFFIFHFFFSYLWKPIYATLVFGITRHRRWVLFVRKTKKRKLRENLICIGGQERGELGDAVLFRFFTNFFLSCTIEEYTCFCKKKRNCKELFCKFQSRILGFHVGMRLLRNFTIFFLFDDNSEKRAHLGKHWSIDL